MRDHVAIGACVKCMHESIGSHTDQTRREDSDHATRQHPHPQNTSHTTFLKLKSKLKPSSPQVMLAQASHIEDGVVSSGRHTARNNIVYMHATIHHAHTRLYPPTSRDIQAGKWGTLHARALLLTARRRNTHSLNSPHTPPHSPTPTTCGKAFS